MVLELYLDLISQPCRVVYIFAKKNRIPFELRHVDLLKGETINKDFAQMSSLQRVPVLKDGDFVLSESVAILFYMIFKYKTDSHWYPSDPHIRARIHEYLGWHGDLVRGTLGVPILIKVIAPICGLQVPEEKLERNKDLIEKTLHRMEEYFLGNKHFLAGQEMTIADLVALGEVMQALGAGCDLFVEHKKLEAWHKRVETFLGADLFQEAHNYIMNILQISATTTIPPPPPGFYPYLRLRFAKIP